MAGKLIKSFAWDFAGRLGGQLISFVISIVLARILTPEEFGLIGMAMVFISLSGVFTNLGLSSALIQRTEPTEEHYSSSFYLNIAAAAFLTVLFIVLAPFIATFFKSTEITKLIRVLSLTLVFNSLSIVQDARFRKKMNFRILTRTKIIASLLSGALGITMAFLGYGVWSLVIQTLSSGLLSSLFLWFYSDWRPKLLFRLRAIKDLWGYSFNLFISGVINTAYEQLDSIVIARLFTAKDLGLFSRAKTLNRFVIKYSSESVGAITFPAMAEVKDNRDQMLNMGLKAETLIAYLSFGLLGLLYVTSEPLILTLIGPKWLPAVEMFKILCLSGFAYPISAATLSMLRAAGFSGSFLKAEVWKKIVGLAGFGVGFYFGIKGYLISLIVTGAISVWLNMFFAGKALGLTVRHQLLPLIPYLLISVSSVVMSYWIIRFLPTPPVALLVVSCLYSLIYLFINFAIKSEGHRLFLMQSKSLVQLVKEKVYKTINNE
jgi:teichuronic acid exporter